MRPPPQPAPRSPLFFFSVPRQRPCPASRDFIWCIIPQFSPRRNPGRGFRSCRYLLFLTEFVHPNRAVPLDKPPALRHSIPISFLYRWCRHGYPEITGPGRHSGGRQLLPRRRDAGLFPGGIDLHDEQPGKRDRPASAGPQLQRRPPQRDGQDPHAQDPPAAAGLRCPERRDQCLQVCPAGHPAPGGAGYRLYPLGAPCRGGAEGRVSPDHRQRHLRQPHAGGQLAPRRQCGAGRYRQALHRHGYGLDQAL